MTDISDAAAENGVTSADFRALGLSETLLDALRGKGFTEPTDIQKLVIPRLLTGNRDLIGQARTGTGKTAAFALPILETLRRGPAVQCLILAPTRELCQQIASEITSLAGASGLRTTPFYGGEPIEIQQRKLARGTDIAVGTPGRILDLLKRGDLKLERIRFAVLDEADEMLDMGFIEDIEAILSQTPAGKRTLMFSATIPDAIRSVAEKFMRDFEVVRAETDDEPCTDLTEQFYCEVKREDKPAALMRFLDLDPARSVLVFCRTKADVDELAEKLTSSGYNIEALHGDIAQGQRTRIINRFKAHRFPVLLATDVAARGIDISDLDCVINYALPRDPDIYIHRIGRTGRAGKKGQAVTFVTPGEMHRFKQIRDTVKVPVARREPPAGNEIIDSKKARFAARIAEAAEARKHVSFRPFAEELLARGPSPCETLAAVLATVFGNELDPERYPGIGAPRQRKNSRKAWEEGPEPPGLVRLFVGVGKADSCGAVKMRDLLWRIARVRKTRVGRIDCFEHHSLVSLFPEDARNVLKNARRAGVKIHPDDRGETSSPAAEKKRSRKEQGAPPPGAPASGLREWVESLVPASPRDRK
ncbi:MAG: DEAD/DEAH box helicase [Lentisphaeria bacterium]|nr:DEAD/DEAH box helicase [Lentisphaeria bacterium]